MYMWSYVLIYIPKRRISKGLHSRENSARINYIIVEKWFSEMFCLYIAHDKSVVSDFMELTYITIDIAAHENPLKIETIAWHVIDSICTRTHSFVSFC